MMELEKRKKSHGSSLSSVTSGSDRAEHAQSLVFANDAEVTIAPNKIQNCARDSLDIRYKIDDVPPWYLCILLGFQHYLTMFGSTATIAIVLAPYLCVSSQSVAISEILSTLFFVSGLVTVMQATFGIRLPIVQGGTFSFLIPIFSLLSLPQWKCPAAPSDTNMTDIANSSVSWLNSTTVVPLTEEQLWKPRMREIQGAIITASLVQVVIGATGVMGVILKYLGPITITPTIALIGMALFDVAADTSATQWGISVLTMVLIALFSQYLRDVDIPGCVAYKKASGNRKLGCRKIKYPFFKMFPVITAILLAWFLCFILTVSGAIKNDENAVGYLARTDLNVDVLYKAKWFRIPYPFQWGLPTFNIAGTLGMIAGVMASMLESIGDYYACARLCGAPPPPTHAVNRGILMEGIGCVFSGMWGSGSGTTSYSENVGAIGITKVGSRRVIQTAGCIMMVLGLFGKFGALFVTIPSPIVGGVFMVMFGMITAVGISNLQYVDLNSSRNLFIVGFAILIGLSVPKWLKTNQDFIDTGVKVLDQIITVLLGTSMFLGGTLAFVLDNTVPGTAEERGILKWREQLGDSPDEDSTSLAKCYEIPFISQRLRKHAWTQYVPFLPTFRGQYCNSKCCKRRGSRTDTYTIEEN